MAQQSTVYGLRSYNHHLVRNFPVGASEVFKAAGGGVLKEDGSGRVEIATATDTNLIGNSTFNEDFTASSTEGATEIPVCYDLDAVFEIPIDTGTWADTMRGETCDLAVTSNVQGVNLSASSTDVIQLIDKGTTNAAGTVVSVLAKLYVPNLTRTAAA